MPAIYNVSMGLDVEASEMQPSCRHKRPAMTSTLKAKTGPKLQSRS